MYIYIFICMYILVTDRHVLRHHLHHRLCNRDLAAKVKRGQVWEMLGQPLYRLRSLEHPASVAV